MGKATDYEALRRQKEDQSIVAERNAGIGGANVTQQFDQELGDTKHGVTDAQIGAQLATRGAVSPGAMNIGGSQAGAARLQGRNEAVTQGGAEMRQMGAADYSRGQNDQRLARQIQMGAAQNYLDVLHGNAPSVAQMQMQQGLDRSLNQQAALAASSRGNPSAALRVAGQQQAQMAQGINREQAILRAQEQEMARQGLLGAGSAIRQGDLSGANLGSQFAGLGSRQEVAGAAMENQFAGAQAQLALQNLEAARNQANIRYDQRMGRRTQDRNMMMQDIGLGFQSGAFALDAVKTFSGGGAGR